MKQRILWRLLMVACCLLPWAAPLAWTAEAVADSAQPVQLEAEELVFDQVTDTYVAEGEVLLRQGEQELRADRMRFNDVTSEAAAFGNVVFTDPDGELSGDEMHLNLASGLGEVANGRIFVSEPNFHVTGSAIAKTAERSYRVENGSFTSCDGEVPSWKFSASDLDVTLGGYAWAKNVKFHIYDVPVLYLPFIGFPVKTERESGLLMPSVGYSGTRGAQLFMSYYQVIARNQDATFYVDYLSRLGLGKGMEYRYVFGHDNAGALRGYHVNGFSGYDDRFAFDWLHRGTLPSEVRLIADIEYISDREFFSDFGEAAGEYNKSKAESVLGVSRHWGKNNLAGQAKYVKNLLTDNDQTLQRLPELRFAMLQQRLWDSPFYFNLDTDGIYWWRKEGMKGARLSVRPALSGVFRLGGVADVTSQIGYLERFYATPDGEERAGLFDFSTRISSRLARAYDVESGAGKRVQHVLQPELLYQYRPSEAEYDSPHFEMEDDLLGYNILSYGLINRLIARSEMPSGEIAYREFLYLRLAQEFNLKESFDDYRVAQQTNQPYSNLRGELIVRPTPESYIDIDTRYDISDGGDLLTFHVETGLKSLQGNSLSLRYRYNKDLNEYLASRFDLALLKPVYLSYENRHEFQGGGNLENVLNLEYRAQCWSFYVSYRTRDGEQEVMLNFGLAGLSGTSHPGARRRLL